MRVAPNISVYKLKQSYTDKYCIKYDTSGNHGLAMNPCLEFADRIFTANTVIYSYNPDESKGYIVDATTNGKIPLNVLELVAKDVKSSDLKKYLNPSKQKTDAKSSIDTQTVALVLGVLVAAYFLTK